MRCTRIKQPGAFVPKVRKVVRDLDRGEVVSYGEVARRAGYPRAARAVGNVLATTHGLPWWRVIRASGELAAGHRQEQAIRLRREGVMVSEGRVKGNFNSRKAVARHRR
ncbi:MAG TPA: MGMT family protein [Candidatus Dormibacteraeota bacterium]|nr:MGMT family protein [Candidatus Dormibacteraeota bacterium]